MYRGGRMQGLEFLNREMSDFYLAMKGKVRDGQVRGDRLLRVGLLGARLLLEERRRRRRGRFHGHDVIVLVLGAELPPLPMLLMMVMMMARVQVPLVVLLLLLLVVQILVEVAAAHSGGWRPATPGRTLRDADGTHLNSPIDASLR